MIDEQPSSNDSAESYPQSVESSNNEHGKEEWRRALFDPLPAWKQGELEAWKRRLEAEQEADRELREEAKRGAL